jgi:hypothetical protein
MTTPLTGNSLMTRADLQTAVSSLWRPVRDRLSPGGARAKLGETGALFPEAAAELEGFARPLWGLAPLAAGGGDVDWSPILAGLTNGTDPGHPEYWGRPTNSDQRLVEMAAIGFALALVPEALWDGLDGRARDRVAAWLGSVNEVTALDTNWQYFQVLANLGLARVGASEYDASVVERSLGRVESFYLGDGWYTDGHRARRDHYVPFALHVYGLVYARLAGEHDPTRAARFRDWAASFAPDFAHWFADDGSALPYGRSLTYRFAQGSFWGALAFADVEALPWGQIKGLLLRHLRWWAGRPIFDHSGVLTIGYGYSNLNMAEEYNSPGSPYWALKAFLPLAQPAEHPFWQADEQPPGGVDEVRAQQHPGMVVYRDSGHVVALTGGQDGRLIRHGAYKYAKLAYSTAFGFSVPTGLVGLDRAGHDSVLALSEDDLHWIVGEIATESAVRGHTVWTKWAPLRGVEVETWVVPFAPWHVRVHYVRCDRPLHTAEGGWALDRTGDDPSDFSGVEEAGEGHAMATYAAGLSGIRDLLGARNGEVVRMAPNSNVLASRTVVPTLRAVHPPGRHWLVSAVLGTTNRTGSAPVWEAPPSLDRIREHVPELPD